MKKKYLKPEVEYISLESENIMTDVEDDAEIEMSGYEKPDGWK